MLIGDKESLFLYRNVQSPKVLMGDIFLYYAHKIINLLAQYCLLKTIILFAEKKI